METPTAPTFTELTEALKALQEGKAKSEQWVHTKADAERNEMIARIVNEMLKRQIQA